MKAATPPPLPPLPPELRPAKAPDPRVNAWRSDLAAKELEGLVDAKRFVSGRLRQVAWPQVPLRRQPVPSASLDTELLFGEAVSVYDEAEGWAWIQSQRDRYVGYVPAAALQDLAFKPTHTVSALGTFVYPIPDIKAPPLSHLSLGCQLAVDAQQDRFCRLASGGFVVGRHVSAHDRPARDFVEIAERFTGTPYLWGGRSRLGLDCSGLLQLSLQATGRNAPRDSDMQEAALGRKIEAPDFDGLERGDLVFWKGHVGLMIDAVMMIHANAHHMAVVVEPLAEAAARIAKTGGPVTAFKRLAGVGGAVS